MWTDYAPAIPDWLTRAAATIGSGTPLAEPQQPRRELSQALPAPPTPLAVTPATRSSPSPSPSKHRYVRLLHPSGAGGLSRDAAFSDSTDHP